MLTLFLAACGASRPAYHVDHVILGVADLDAGMRELEARTGIRATLGGNHPEGTRNALVSLGPSTYLELLAPSPGADSADIRELRRLSSLTPLAVAIAAPDIAKARARLAGAQPSEPQPGSRTTTTGVALRWTTFGIATADEVFFIHWDDPATHPARTTPGGCRLVELRTKPLPIAIESVVQHTGARLAVTLRCGARDVRFEARE